jgi:hypothetical protein
MTILPYLKDVLVSLHEDVVVSMKGMSSSLLVTACGGPTHQGSLTDVRALGGFVPGHPVHTQALARCCLLGRYCGRDGFQVLGVSKVVLTPRGF